MISTPRSTASKKQQPGKGPVSTPKTEDKMIVRALRAEIAGPLEGSWSDLGPQLRAWASAVHHMANEGVLAAHVAARDPKKKVAPQTAAYRAAGQAQEDFKAWAKRKGGDAKEQQLRGELAFGGGVQAAIGAMSFTALKKWQKERGQIASFRKGSPLPVRAQETKIYEHSRTVYAPGREPRTEEVIALDMRIGDKTQPRTRLRLMASKGWHWETLRALAAGTLKHGEVKIVYDDRARRKDGSRGKWYALIAYSQLKPTMPAGNDPAKLLVVHRGLHNFVCMIGSGGEGPYYIRGNKLRAQKDRFKGMRRDMASISASELGSGAKGRGTGRRSARLSKCLDKEGRCVKTFCQQTNAAIQKIAQRIGAGTILVGEYGGMGVSEDRGERRFIPRFPYYQLKQAIVSGSEGAGRQVREVSEAYVSQTCPACANQDASQHVERTRMFHCKVCGFDRSADHVSTILMLRRAEPPVNGWDDKLRKERAIGIMLAKQEAAAAQAAE